MEESSIYSILEKKEISESVVRMRIHAPRLVRHARAGQFCVLIVDDRGERLPLTIAEADRETGSVVIIFQVVGFSTRKLAQRKEGDILFALLGPLGRPTQIEKFGTVFCVAGGVGVAEVLPVVKAFKKAGNRLKVIIGARAQGLLILEDELRSISDELFVTTNDGSYGRKGVVTDLLKELLGSQKCDRCYAVGPIPMMKEVARITALQKVETIVSLNPLMVDATGMCAVCRCRVAGKTVFSCVDGPEFPAHDVDFEELEKRLAFFKKEEDFKNGQEGEGRERA